MCVCVPLIGVQSHIFVLALSVSQNSEVRSQFQEFLSLNVHQLEQCPFPDVVQLALCQPQTSEVYRQALVQAQQRASAGRLYFDWLYVSGTTTTL